MKITYKHFLLPCGILLALVELFKLVNPYSLYCGYYALLELSHITQSLSPDIFLPIGELMLYAGVFLSGLACFVLAVKLCKRQPSLGVSIASLACNMVFWVLYGFFLNNDGILYHLDASSSGWFWIWGHFVASILLGVTHFVLMLVSHIKAKKSV